jgi:hypothetical protein
MTDLKAYHRDMLRSICILQNGNNALPNRAYKALSELRGLKNLTIDVHIDEGFCQPNATYTYSEFGHSYPPINIGYKNAQYYLVRDAHRSKITITIRPSTGAPAGTFYNDRVVPQSLLSKL